MVDIAGDNMFWKLRVKGLADNSELAKLYNWKNSMKILLKRIICKLLFQSHIYIYMVGCTYAAFHT